MPPRVYARALSWAAVELASGPRWIGTNPRSTPVSRRKDSIAAGGTPGELPGLADGLVDGLVDGTVDGTAGTRAGTQGRRARYPTGATTGTLAEPTPPS